MIEVHEEPAVIQKMFKNIRERCEFCGTPTRFWDSTKQHTVCQSCASTHSPNELKGARTNGQSSQ